MNDPIAPYIIEVQEAFCPPTLKHEVKLVYSRDGREIVETRKGELYTEPSLHKVKACFILRNLAEGNMHAIAIVASGGGNCIQVSHWYIIWQITTINVETKLAQQLLSSKLGDYLKYDNSLCIVANINGGRIWTREDFEQEKIKQREEKIKQEAKIEQVLLQKMFTAKAKYALTCSDVQKILPLSPERILWPGGYKFTKVKQVYTLLGQDLTLLACAIIYDKCTWLKYNNSGLAIYGFTPQPRDAVEQFTAVLESSPLGNRLFQCKYVGDTIKIKHEDFLVINIGGGDVALWKTSWQEEKTELERRKYKLIQEEKENYIRWMNNTSDDEDDIL